jgi:GABA(A) receptor-associated protein
MGKFQEEWEKKSLEDRKTAYDNIITKHSDRIPVIFFPNIRAPKIDKNKFLFQSEGTTIAHLTTILRNRIGIQPEEAIFIWIENTFPCQSSLLRDVQQKYQNEDGFLYVSYSLENTFG